MRFKTSDLDTKIKEIVVPNVVGHDRTLREQIEHDEKLFGLEHSELDIFDDDELNMHIDFLEYRHGMGEEAE